MEGVLYCKWQYGMRARMRAFPLFDAMPGRGGTMCAHVRHCAGRRDLFVSLRGEGVSRKASASADSMRIQEMRSLLLAGTSADSLTSPLLLSPRPAAPPPKATLPQLHVKSPSICVLIRAPLPPHLHLRLAEWPLH